MRLTNPIQKIFHPNNDDEVMLSVVWLEEPGYGMYLETMVFRVDNGEVDYSEELFRRVDRADFPVHPMARPIIQAITATAAQRCFTQHYAKVPLEQIFDEINTKLDAMRGK